MMLLVGMDDYQYMKESMKVFMKAMKIIMGVDEEVSLYH